MNEKIFPLNEIVIVKMMKNNFEQFVREAILALPDHARKVMENVIFIIEQKSRPEKAREIGIKANEILLGLYEGVPKIKRGENYSGVIPDKITIFQQPIEELTNHDEEKIKKLIYEVVWHEVGHHLGFDEKEIRAIETKKKQKL